MANMVITRLLVILSTNAFYNEDLQQHIDGHPPNTPPNTFQTRTTHEPGLTCVFLFNIYWNKKKK